MKTPDFSVLKSNRSFWTNPFSILLSAVVLFLGSEIFGSMIATLLSPYVVNQNVQLVVSRAAVLLSAVGIISIARQVIGFSWKDLGWQSTKLSSYAKIIPAFLIYFVISATFTIFATKFIIRTCSEFVNTFQ